MRFALPLLALAALAVPAGAETGEETVTVRIALADIDLSTQAGRAALDQRIEARITEACTIESRARYALGRRIVDETCVAEARVEASAKAERLAAEASRSNGAVSAN